MGSEMCIRDSFAIYWEGSPISMVQVGNPSDDSEEGQVIVAWFYYVRDCAFPRPAPRRDTS